tara:strand:+ start:1221 stop:1862 length:642 start_codon:yes stop_codon:yes gene_type:complete
MVKNILYIVLTLTVSIGAFAQSDSSQVEDYVIENPDYVVPFKSLTTKDKMHYSFGMGVGFGTSTDGDYFSTYYQPMISYDVSPKFTINTGLTYINSSVNNVPVITDYQYKLFSGNISQYNAFIGGEYKLSERLSVGGSIFYDFTSYNAISGTSLDAGNGLENLGYSGYVKYKVSDSFSIQAEVRVNDKNPYRNRQNSPFSKGFMGMGRDFLGR